MESASDSAFRAAPAEEEADVKIPVGWKNLLRTACLAGAGRKGACAPPEAGFGRGIVGREELVGHRVLAVARARGFSSRRQRARARCLDPAERRKGRVMRGVALLA